MAAAFWAVTSFFIALEVLFYLGVTFTGKSGDNGLKHVLCATTVVCLWLMWVIVYIAQLHPLVSPILQG